MTDRYHLARGDELEREVAIARAASSASPTGTWRARSRRSPGASAGGCSLGVVLAQQPDLLLLDEPTNHLDLDTIAWLESGTSELPRRACSSSRHDRAFLDNVAPRTMELGSRSFRVYPLKYSDYVVAREEDLERERALVERQQALIDKTEDFIRKNIAGQKTKQAQSRRKMLDKLDRLERPEDVWPVGREGRASASRPAARTGDIVLDAKGLGAERGGRVLFDGVDPLVRRGERIGIVGPNGVGQDDAAEAPRGARRCRTIAATSSAGRTCRRGTSTSTSARSTPRSPRSRRSARVRGDFTVEAARQYLARFRFWGDDPLRVVSRLLRRRARRASRSPSSSSSRATCSSSTSRPTTSTSPPPRSSRRPSSASRARSSSSRTTAGSSRTTTTRIVSVRDGVVDIYPGGFRDYVAAHTPAPEPAGMTRGGAGGNGRKKSERPPAKSGGGAPAARPVDEAAVAREKQRAFEEQRNRARAEERKKKRVVELEKTIADGEKELEAMRAVLREDPGGDWAKLAEMAKKEQALGKRVEAMMSEWEKLSGEAST